MNFPAAPNRAAVAALAVGLALGLASCGDDPQRRSEANYCAEVSVHLSDLNAPLLVSPVDIERVIDAWRSVARSAPLAVEAEWDTMVNNLETAATVDPSDTASMQRVADTARRSEPAANLVITYTQQKCGVAIATGAPSSTSPATTAAVTTVSETTVSETTVSVTTVSVTTVSLTTVSVTTQP